MSFGAGYYPPHMWRTGNEPMTNPQSDRLYIMSKSIGVDMPFVSSTSTNGQRVTKAEASLLLTMLRNGVHINAAFIEGLGRDEPQVGPGHPSTWSNCHDPPTLRQIRWIRQLAWDMCIMPDDVAKSISGITLGQASRLIELLRAGRGDILYDVQTAEWLADVVARAIEEVPLPQPDEPEGEDVDTGNDSEDEEDMLTEEEEIEMAVGDVFDLKVKLEELPADAQL